MKVKEAVHVPKVFTNGFRITWVCGFVIMFKSFRVTPLGYLLHTPDGENLENTNDHQMATTVATDMPRK